MASVTTSGKYNCGQYPSAKLTEDGDDSSPSQTRPKPLIQHQQREKKRTRYRRSATLSPAAGAHRRKYLLDVTDSSDSNDEASKSHLSPAQFSSSPFVRRPTAASKRSASPMHLSAGIGVGGRVQRKPELPSFARRQAQLRKTCSEPTDLFVDECDRNKVERIQDILNSLNFNKFHLIKTTRGGGGQSDSATKIISTSATVTTSNRISNATPLSPSNSLSSYASGRSSPLLTPSQSPEETWATPRGSLFIPTNGVSADRPSTAALAFTRLVEKHPHLNDTDSSDFVATDIEELREAAQTIEALTRRSRRRPNDLLLNVSAAASASNSAKDTDATPMAASPVSQNLSTPIAAPVQNIPSSSSTSTLNDRDVSPSGSVATVSEKAASNGSLPDAAAATLPRRSGGITARLGGQPRGVMQFLPSVKSSEFLSKTAYESYLSNKTRRAQLTPGSTDSNYDASSLPVTPAVPTSGNAPLLRRKVSMPEQLYHAGQDQQRYNRQLYHQYYHYKQPEHEALTDADNISSNSAPNPICTIPVVGKPVDLSVVSGDEYLALSSYPDRKMSAPPASSSRENGEHDEDKFGQQPTNARFSSLRTGGAKHTSKLMRQYSQQERQFTDILSESIAAGAPVNESALKGVDSLGSFSRFGRLLKSLRGSRQNSPEMDLGAFSPASSDSPPSSPCPSEQSRTTTGTGGTLVYQNYHHHHPNGRRPYNHVQEASRPRSQMSNTDATGDANFMSQSWHSGVSKIFGDLGAAAMSDSDSSMLQADLLLWQKRSKGSLRRHQDTRTHIVKELYDTEASYVENLQLIVHKYLRPLKRPELCTLIDPALVDEIFFQIPEVLGHHELFFAALKSRLDNWDNRQKVGDIILNNFTKQSVIDTYTAFINNWKSAKHAIRAACQAKPAFAKYLERCSREHKNKLTLDALLIMPVQRIPRYELLIKELLKHTSVEHPDHPLLLRAQKEIHELATKINHVEQEAGLSEQMQQRLREIEAIVDGLDDLVTSDRVFYRYDLVSISTHGGKKERCLFLFSDQLIITNVKRKSAAALRKMPTMNASSAAACNFLDSNKFKLLMKISLDDLEVTKNNTAMLHKIQEEVSQLQEDVRVLGKVSELLLLLKVHHDDVEKEVEKLKDYIRKQLSDKHQEMTTNPVLTSVDLLVTTEAGIEALSVTFQSADKRVAWEKCFSDAKEALALSMSRRPPPVFLKPIAAQRTRSGLHFTCAAPTIGRNEYGYPNVWVCNSDGYVGQVCVVNLTPEPDLASCNGITNSRILCVCAVPDAKHSAQKRVRKTSTAATSPASQASSVVDSGYNLELDSESSDNESSNEGAKSNAQSVNGSTTSGVGATSAGSNEPTSSSSSLSTDKRSPKPVPGNDSATIVSEESSTTPAEESNLPTMWLGTDDGCVHIFNFNDSVRTRKNKTKMQHGAPVLAICYVDDRVFVALGDGALVYYDRDQDGHWDLDHYRFIELEQLSRGPISVMLMVTNKLWLGVRNRICVLNPHTLKLEHIFQASSDVDSVVSCMSTSGLGVWLSMQNSPVIKLHHAHSYECLLESNVSPIVTKTLAGCDDIIRQHKLACLRVTTLLCCKDFLWIGTSSGVLLHLSIPHITHNTTRLNNTPALTCVPLGHCGQCRFLTCVELSQNTNLSRSSSRAGSYTTINELSRRRMSLNVATLQQGKVYVISGGDGFEDFQDMTNDEGDENTGRDDSTSHLLVWQA